MKKFFGMLKKKKRVRTAPDQDYYQNTLNSFGAEQFQKIISRGLRAGLTNV